MGLTPQISLGDLAVVASVLGSAWLTLRFIRTIIESLNGRLLGIEGRLDTHAKARRVDRRRIEIHGQQIASLNGAVFGRRISDQAPTPDEDVPDDDL